MEQPWLTLKQRLNCRGESLQRSASSAGVGKGPSAEMRSVIILCRHDASPPFSSGSFIDRRNRAISTAVKETIAAHISCEPTPGRRISWFSLRRLERIAWLVTLRHASRRRSVHSNPSGRCLSTASAFNWQMSDAWLPPELRRSNCSLGGNAINEPSSAKRWELHRSTYEADALGRRGVRHKSIQKTSLR